LVRRWFRGRGKRERKARGGRRGAVISEIGRGGGYKKDER